MGATLLGCHPGGEIHLSGDAYLDKCRGAWAGQMVGVCWGDPYQFQSNGRPITGPIRPWVPEMIAGALKQDDCYVELTFLKALETHGLDITPEQAGRAFAEPGFALYHANKYGRENIRRGILPPWSGHPLNNRHADDIDFQIEADVLGLVCPGLPQESNRLCDIFGHIMNYGDGVYGGMFVAGMYTAAFAPGADVHRVVATGLACVPRESQFHKCISDVVRWHRECPTDWLTVWQRIEDKWQDDVDCAPGDPYNIDAKLNGAYVVMGLLYGGGDLLKTVEIAIRCGQDADSTASNAGGVVGCIRGYRALGDATTRGIPAIASQRFSHTDYSFDTAVAACQRVAESVIRRAGGRVLNDAYAIPRQMPTPPPTLEQWTDQKSILLSPVTQEEVDLWSAGWVVESAAPDAGRCVLPQEYGSTSLLALAPVTPERPAAISRVFELQSAGPRRLEIDVASTAQDGPFVLRVFVNDRLVKDVTVDTRCRWTTVDADLPQGPASVRVRIEVRAHSGRPTAAFVRRIDVK